MSNIRHFRELEVYQRALKGTLRISELSKAFPADERFSLTDQMRRSSRSVCANLAEAWRKRRYPAAFISKLSDAETEAAETQVPAEIAFHHGYLTEQQFRRLDDYYDKIIGQLVRMIDAPDKWLIKRKDQP
ncbi:MAG TPA: four helix bundle protein [Chthoniobacter sp.]|nr:four helix bundle protein [Chthoniobacter sp.]